MFDLVGRQGCGTRSSNVEVTMDPKMGNEKSGLGFHNPSQTIKIVSPGDGSHRQEGHPTLVTQRPPYTLHGGNTLSA